MANNPLLKLNLKQVYIKNEGYILLMPNLDWVNIY